MNSVDVWLVDHPLFRALAVSPTNPGVLAAYVEAFAPVVNSVPAFLHVTLSRSNGRVASLLREIWNDELGLSGTPSHPVLFDQLHNAVVSKFGGNIEVQSLGVTAAGDMIHLCSSGPWPIGVAAMKAHESQFPASYTAILDNMEAMFGVAAEFFRVHSYADIEHTKAATALLQQAIEAGVITIEEVDGAFYASTVILRNLMDGIWAATRTSQTEMEAR